MKHKWAVGLTVILAGTGLWWLKSPRPVSEPVAAAPGVETPVPLASTSSPVVTPSEAEHADASPEAITNPVLAGPVLAQPKPIALAAAEEPPAGPEVAPGLTPGTVLENVRAVFRQYHLRFGHNPVGTNPEITATLNGRNPRQVVFLNPEDGLRVNAQGELVDNWDTPLFFHQLSRTEMEIHSAGPDRTMWSPDDLVIK